MQVWDLNDRQLSVIQEQFEKQRKYHQKLLQRMRIQRFPENDPLRMQVERCAEKLGQLNLFLEQNIIDLQNGRRRPGMRPKGFV